MLTLSYFDGGTRLVVDLEFNEKWSSHRFFLTLLGTGAINPEHGMVIPAEDDDVARERELIQGKPISVLQKDNNLVIK